MVRNAKLQLTSLSERKNTRLPDVYGIAHQFCFFLHDNMLQLLLEGQKAGAFQAEISFENERDKEEYNRSKDVFEWLDKTKRDEDRVNILTALVFPAILGDMLHIIYEVLETSRKGKLTISYMLLRKPLQESLFVLESIAVDPFDFASKMNSDPTRLHSQKAGNLNVHIKRIEKALFEIDKDGLFDSDYISRLRYDKSSLDGFDPICNKAIHLFTTSETIKTQRLNVNMIFSSYDDVISQWSFLYSRLPYILRYMHKLVEYVCMRTIQTAPLYVREIESRISSLTLLWWDNVDPEYSSGHLRNFVLKTRDKLFQNCSDANFRHPSRQDLTVMANIGAYPGESNKSVRERAKYFTQISENPEKFLTTPEPIPRK